MKKLIYILPFLTLSLFGQKDTPLDDWFFTDRAAAVAAYDVPDYTDPQFTTVIYIDPDASTNGVGTISDPMNVWPSNLASNTAYLQKSGTSYSGANEYRYDNYDHLYIGAYGTGDKPIIYFTGGADKRYTMQFSGDSIVYSGVHFQMRVDVGGYDDGGTGCWVYDCEITGESVPDTWDMLVVWDDATKVIGCDIHDVPQEGIYVNSAARGGANCEFAWNHIYKINQKWYPGATDSTAHGDGIQITSSDNYWIHHNIADKSDVGNKFCIITRDETGVVTDYNGLIENNVLYIPIENGDEGGAGLYCEDDQTVIIRNNAIVATSSHTTMNCVYLSDYSGGMTIEFYGNLVYEGVLDIAPTNLAAHDITVFNNTFVLMNGTGASSWDYNENNINQKYTSGEPATNIIVDTVGASNLFTSPNTTDYDYTLKAGSDAIEAGAYQSYMSDYTADINEQRVPQNDSISSGAYQYNTGAAVPTFCDTINITETSIITNADLGQSNGAINISVFGNGITPYTYLWSNDSTTQDLTNIPAGTYSVIITDDSLCSIAPDAYIVNPITPTNQWYDSLSYWWTFNNTYADTFDVNNATNVATSLTTDKDGNANFAVTTTGSYMTIDDLNFGAADEWTLMWLMYPEGTYKEIFKYDANNEIIYASNKLRIDNTGTWQEFGHAFTQEEWVHVALVAQASNYLRLYVDSVLIDSLLLSDNALQIDEISGSGTPFTGDLDEIMVAYNAFPLEGIKEAMKKFPVYITYEFDTISRGAEQKDEVIKINKSIFDYTASTDTIVTGTSSISEIYRKTNIFIDAVPETENDTILITQPVDSLFSKYNRAVKAVMNW